MDLIAGWDPGWADIVISGPSAYGKYPERGDREMSWTQAFRRALKSNGLLVTVWPFKDMWGWGKVLHNAKYCVQALYRVTCNGAYPNWASQCILVARVSMGPQPVKPLNTHFESMSQPGWSSGYHPEIPERVAATLAGPEDVILEPFFGLGNTAIGCIRAGRPNWVGCEKDAARIPQAYDRIESQTDWRRGEDQGQGSQPSLPR